MATRIRNLSVGTDNIDVSISPVIKPRSLKFKIGKLYLDNSVLRVYNVEGYCVSKNEVEKLGYTFVCSIAQLVNRGIAYRYVSFNKDGNKLKNNYIQTGIPGKALKDDDLKVCGDIYIRCDYLLSALGFKK